MMHRCKVEAHVRGTEWGINLGPGAVYDLELEVAPGIQLKAVVDPEWFEEVEAEA
jgi:hypothetical protein